MGIGFFSFLNWNSDWSDILMAFIDWVILISVIIFISLIVYFNFIKNKGSKCNSCNLKNDDSLVKKYYQKKTRGM